MERSLFDITLDLQKCYTDTPLTVKRGDTHRTLRIRLCDGGRPYTIAPGTKAVFTAVKPDGNHLYNGCRVEKDTVFYDLTPQTTAIPGELECELRLYDGEGALLTTAAFRLEVADTVYADGDESVASSGEATALTRLLEETEEKLEQMDQVLKNEVNHAIIDDSTISKDAWSSKKIADMFCPAFQTQGAYPTCQPLEGYPLEAVSTIAPKTGGDLWEQITLHHSGKNLYDFKQPVSLVKYMSSTGEIGTRYGYSVNLPAGTYTIHAEPIGEVKNQYIYGYINDLKGNYMPVDGFGILKQAMKYYPRTFTVTEPVRLYIYNGYTATSISGDEASTNRLFQNENNVQIEVGTVQTDYEPYRGQTYTADFAARPVAEGSYNWGTGLLVAEDGSPYQHDPATGKIEMLVNSAEADKVLRRIPAVSGVNYLASDCGETYVSGRQDLKTWLTERSQE